MKIVVIGGTGLVGKKVVSILTTKGHEVVAASPSTGVNALTGEGLDAAFSGSQVAAKDPRKVIVDPEAGYFGALIDDRSLTPGDGAWIGAVHFDAWLKPQG